MALKILGCQYKMGKWETYPKLSQNWIKKTAKFDFFRFSLKLLIHFEQNFLQAFFTIVESYMCNGIKIVWLVCQQNSQNEPKKAKNGPFGVSIFSKAVCTNWTKFSAVIQRYIRVLYVQWHENTMTGMWKTLPKIARNWLKKRSFSTFLTFSKTLLTIRTKFSAVTLRVPNVQWHWNRMAGMWEI